jgi:opacity protein-like surface antigen
MQRRSEPLRVAIFLLLACLAPPLAASGASSEEAPQPARERRYVFGYLGALDAEADANALGDPGTSFAFGLGGGYRRRPSLGLEVDVTFNVRTYDVPEDTPNPLFGTIDKLTLTSALSFFNVKATYPGKRVEPFVGGGAGLSYSELELRGSLLGFSGTVDKERDFVLAFQLVAGVDFVVSKRANFGLEFRSIHGTSDFGELSGGSIEIGGRLFAFSYKFFF